MSDDEVPLVALGGRRFDPRSEQLRQDDTDDDEPVEPDAVAAWIVQLDRPLEPDSRARLTTAFGLRLTDYVPRLAYLERLTPEVVSTLRGDPMVRAVMRFEGAFKSPASGLATSSDEEDDEPAVPVLVDVVLFPGVEAQPVVAAVHHLGLEDVLVLDDREHGGTITLRVRTPDPGRLERLRERDDVRWVAPVPETVDDAPSDWSPPSGAPPMTWSGAGQIVGLIDKGPPDLDHCFFRDAADNVPGPDHRKVVAVRNASKTSPGSHATFVGGCLAGDDVADPGGSADRGLAWGARLSCGNRLDLEGSSMLAELTAAADTGARVHSNSFHSKPQGPGLPATYDKRSADVDTFTWLGEDHLVVGSSGNTGEEQGPPGTAKNALCVSCSAIDPAAEDVGDGNPGPTADGRRKPEVTVTACGLRSAVEGTDSDLVEKACASSWAAPRAAALAAIVRQYLTDPGGAAGVDPSPPESGPSGALLRAVLIAAAGPRDQSSQLPDPAHGWGHIDPTGLFPGSRSPEFRWCILDARHATGLALGDVREAALAVEPSEQPLTVCLAWSDPPGGIGADRATVNDLDLVVTDPAGLIFRGNAFADGQSVPDGSRDDTNTVEVVVRRQPTPGTWRIRVHAEEVNGAGPRQGFALVAMGACRWA